MKNPSRKIGSLTCLVLILSTGCSDEFLEKLMNGKGLAKRIRLSEMVHNDRQYQFTYDNKGHVDYITVAESGQTIYAYDVTYKNKRLFSSALVENGKVVSENSDFEFDEKGNITGYTYTWYVEDVPGGVSTVYDLEYDDQNRLISILTDQATSGHELTYDNSDNVTRWITPYSERTYTYDNKVNPLNLVPDLFFLLVEEASFWEFIVSEHNLLTRSELTTSTMQTRNTTYSNEYDQYFRLVRKTDEEGNEFAFVYQE